MRIGPAAELRATWKALGDQAGPLRTLDPQRELATSLESVHERALAELGSSDFADRMATGLIALVGAQHDAFPGNLFWDLDLIACEVAREAAATADPGPVIVDRFERLARLQSLYGRATAINFSYVHDFVYGYDWVKWLGRRSEPEPVPRPFSLVFLLAMEQRAHELLELIATGDRTYPPLVDQLPRNPFPFSRKPDDEVRLHRALARRGAIPVPSWSAELDTAALDWRRPWAEERRRLAVDLGLATAS